MEVIKAHIENILSIEDLHISFEPTGLVLVDGWNADDNRANGAGKSAIFNAISFALFEKIPRKITKTEILRKGTKKGSSYVEVKVGANTYAVKRSRPTDVQYFINGIKSDISQGEFEDFIGLNYDQFLITMYTAQNTNNKFIFLNDKGKKDFILQLMKLASFNEFHKTAKTMISSIENNILILEQDLKSYQAQIKIYKESITDADELNKQIVAHTTEINEFQKSMIKLQTIKQPDVSKYSTLEQKIAETNTKLTQVEIERNQALSEYQQQKYIAEQEFVFIKPQADAECPECNTPLVIQGQSLTHVADTSAQEKAAREAHEIKVAEAKECMLAALKSIKSLDEKLNDRTKVNALEQKLIEQKQSDFKEYDNAQSSIAEYQRCISSRNQTIQYLQEKLDNNITVVAKIKKIVKEAQEVQKQKKELQDELETVKFCSQIFAPTGAPAYIMDGLIDLFNEAVSEYVQMIWPSATYQLKTHKVNSDKTVVAKFSEELMIGGKIRSIGSMSGGELRSLSLALDFAILDVLTTQYGTTINPIILDEPFDGLDAVGREIVVDLLQRLSQKRQIIVVDHMSESKTYFDKIIKVEKKNGISNIVPDSDE